MEKKKMNWCKVSKKDVQNDFEHLLSYYNFDINQKVITLRLDEIENFGVKLENKTTSAIANTKYTQLHDAIIFYSKSPKCDVKELMRHFKNLVSHPNNIKKAKFNGTTYYQIRDYNLQNKKFTMKGVVSTGMWKIFITKVICEINNNLKLS